jgi:hypothetical protein
MRIRDISISLFLAFAMAPALACSQKGETFTFQNQGELCLFPEAETDGNPGSAFGATTPRDYLADQSVNVAVVFAGCLSSSCDVDRTASCSVQAAGADLRVTSEGSFRTTGASTCTTDCGYLIARCTTPALAAGSYTFRHGDLSLPIQIPSSGPPPCVGSHSPTPLR